MAVITSSVVNIIFVVTHTTFKMVVITSVVVKITFVVVYDDLSTLHDISIHTARSNKSPEEPNGTFTC